ncbi:restriction endonuclease subunit S [Staphylococcus epidermidis]|nr:restriction endonuclease subunit S [Staphylococcus epidermidis]MCG1135337.1 restriction endonuclease subunit S [Staphylococcus epidermidis]MCG1514811.1 restriction endonuclease subunit S [Staphylococcus epidermidis]
MEFNKFKLKELLQVNPRMTLKKGSKAKKIAMENIKEFQKKIDNFTIEEFKSGSKFQNGDTLLARITPCLENGKTAYVDILEDDEIAFGSTEFFVLRPIDNKLDSQFLYYLFRTKKVREIIIKSMTGTSGRQRAQKDSILEYECEVPTIEYQRKIAIILKNLDDKIEINKKIIANLEELSQTLFKRWFVDFEFPDKDGNPYKSSGGEMIDSELGEIPKNWNVLTINDFADDLIITGKTPSTKNKDNYSEKGIPFLTIPDMHTDVFSLNTIKYISEVGIEKVKNKIIPENSLCVSCIATPGLVSITSSETLTNQQINSFTPKKNDLYYLYFYIKNMKKYIEDLGSGGSATLNLNKTQFSKIKIIRPINDLLKKFHKCVDSNFKIILTKQKENLKLQELRDTFLPKLMSGELEIPDDVEVNTDELSI